MSLGKRLFIGEADTACLTDSVQPFGVDSAYSSNVALYQLDGNANDTVGNHNGTASTSVTYSTGKFGQCAVFNGSATTQIEIPDSNSFSPASNPITVSMWVKTTSTADYLASKAQYVSPSNQYEWGLSVDSSGNLKLECWTSAGSTHVALTSSANINDGNWHHVAFSILHESEYKLYADGLNVASTSSYSNTMSNTAANVYLGARGDTTNERYTGSIDQVRFFDKVLSDHEMSILYNETTDTVSDTNVLDEGSGVALYSLDYDASDASGNYDGTATDVTFGVDGQINYGASFNGSSSEIQFTTDSNFVNDFSISAWINMNQLPASSYLYQVVAWGDEATGERRSLSIWNGGSGDPKVYFSGFGSAANFGGSTSVSANQWYHVCVTRSGSTVKVYLDGNLDGTGTVTLNSYTGTTGRIGNSASANEHFNGTIDQVRIFQKALSSDEVDTLYLETACVYTSTTDQVNYQGTNAAYYKLDNTAEDETGNYDGTETDITYEFGRFGQAAVFNGSSSFIEINKSIFGTGDGTADVFTISLWFKTTGNNALLAGTRGDSNTQGFVIWLQSDGTIRYDEANGTGTTDSLTTTSTYNDGNWHNVVVTRNSSNQATLYAGGSVQVSTKTITTPLTSHSNNLNVGRYSGNSLYFDGSIDQVRIYNSALDATAVENLYNEKPETDTSNFNAVLYEGNGSSQYVSNVGFQPDLVWVKRRDTGMNAVIFDSVRTVGANKELTPAESYSEGGGNSGTYGYINSLDVNGFTLTSGSTNSNLTNADGGDYVAWVWKGGGDAVNNTNGDITSQVSANQDAGFSIVKYTGNLSAITTATGESVGHGLSSPPELIIFKRTSNTSDWNIFSSELDNWSTRLQFDTSQKNDLYSQYPIADPTSSVFYTNYLSALNVSGSTYIAYCFHSVAGYQKIGSFTYSAGVSVNVGFEPQFVMFKKTTGGSWTIVDNKRFSGSTDFGLFANLSNAEVTNTDYLNLTSTGFTTTYSDTGTFIYLAIA